MRTLAVSSGKGGAGKSSVAAYTGAALANHGQKVLLIEMGANARSLDLILGVASDILYDFSDVVAGRCSADRAIVQTSYHGNLSLLPGPPLPMAFMPDIPWFRKLLAFFREEYDILLLDGVDFHAFPVSLVDKVLLVLTPDSLAIRSTALHSHALYQAGATEMRLIFNKVSPTVLPMYGARDFDDIIDTVGAQLLGVIPTSPTLEFCSNNTQTLEDSTLPVQVFDSIARRLLGEHPLLLVK